MRTEPEDLTGMLGLGRRQTRFGLTGVEAEARPRRQDTKFPEASFVGNSRQGLWQVRTSPAASDLTPR